MQHHFHTDPVHILVTTAGVLVTIHAGRLAAAWAVRKGGKIGQVGKIAGSILSFPATATVAG